MDLALAPGLIDTMEKAGLFPYLLPLFDMEQHPGEGYSKDTTPPTHWFMTLDGDTWADVDLTESDCGNEHRAANFVRALMWNAGQEGVCMGLQLLEPGGYFTDDAWTQPMWSATAGKHRAVADSPELALLRAYLTLVVVGA